MKIAFSIYLEEEVVKRLDAEATRRAVSRSWVVQRHLENAVGWISPDLGEAAAPDGKEEAVRSFSPPTPRYRYPEDDLNETATVHDPELCQQIGCPTCRILRGEQ